MSSRSKQAKPLITETLTYDLDGSEVVVEVRAPRVRDQLTRDRWGAAVPFELPKPDEQYDGHPRFTDEMSRLYFYGFCKVMSRTVSIVGLDLTVPGPHASPQQLVDIFEAFIDLDDGLVTAWTELAESLEKRNKTPAAKAPEDLTGEEQTDPNSESDA